MHGFKSIEKYFFTFYSKLYSSNYSLGDANIFLDKIQNAILCVGDSFKDLCETVLIEEY